MKKDAMIQVSITDLENCISKMNTLLNTSQESSASRMQRPTHKGRASAVAVLESIADLCEQIEQSYDALVTATIQFLTSAKNEMVEADKRAEQQIR